MWSSTQPSQQSSNTNPKTLGMTSAISTASPTPTDILRTKELEDALAPHDVFETEEELTHRIEVLGKLYALVRQWVKDVSVSRNIPENVAEMVGGKIYTFGSYRLGVHHKGADIDALCVTPRHINRSDYFGSFMELLQQQPEVTELRVSKFSILTHIVQIFEECRCTKLLLLWL